MNATRLLLILWLLSPVALRAQPRPSAAPAEPAPVSAAGEVKMADTSKPIDVTDADISLYLGGYPKMTTFMQVKGAALEKAGSDPSKATAGTAGMEAEFEKAVGISFARFFEIHSAVSAAFAEALAERSRVQQKKSLTDSIAELHKQLAAKETPAELKKQLQQQLTEMELGLKEFEQPMPPEPNLSPATRQAVRAKLDLIEKVYTEQNVPGGAAPMAPSPAREESGDR